MAYGKTKSEVSVGDHCDFIEIPDNFRSSTGSAQKTDYSKGQGKSGGVQPKRTGDKCC